ncbi:MAG: TolC family protein [Bacteroidetes bacterium]|nr:TolC family protein [Bacteroidota bacterium]MBU2584272.1 TolC family protein [Bacteroidota bacterium]
MRLFRLLIVFSFIFVISIKAQYKLSLKEAVKIANENNPEVISAIREIDAADGRILQAGRLQNAEFSVEANEIPSGFSIGETGELDLNFSQPLEFFGKRSTRIQSAELQKKIAKLNFERIKKLIASEVKKAYYSGLLSNQIVENIESNINLLNDFLEQVTDRYKAGTSSYLDIIRAKVEISRLKNELFDAMKNYQQVTGQLKILLGRENGTEFELSDSLFYLYPEINKDTIINFYSSQSNFLRITEIQVEQSKSLLSLAEKKSLPDFNFGLAFQNRQSIPANGFNQFFGLNVGVSLPMFYSTGVQGDVQEAEANLSISDIRFQYARRLVEQNIRTAFNNLSFAEEQLRLFDTSLLRDVEDGLRAGITAYQNGQIDLLNLFDIYRTYRITKVEYSRTVYNTLVALTDLEITSEVIK